MLLNVFLSSYDDAVCLERKSRVSRESRVVIYSYFVTSSVIELCRLHAAHKTSEAVKFAYKFLAIECV